VRCKNDNFDIFQELLGLPIIDQNNWKGCFWSIEKLCWKM
jgi:hypothetical protein